MLINAQLTPTDVLIIHDRCAHGWLMVVRDQRPGGDNINPQSLHAIVAYNTVVSKRRVSGAGAAASTAQC
jgi:hypothetical protein